MGNDGGSIPKRRELVKEAAKSLTSAQLKEAQNEQQEYGWTTDPLTRKPLARPVVSDAAGLLYNKDSIIEYLLKPDTDREKDEMRKVGGVKGAEGGFAELGAFGDRVKALKDVVEVKFEVVEGQRELSARGEKWVCPITGTELGPGAKACYIVPCGHAFRGSVVKEVGEGKCLQCNESYAENDVIPILPTAPTDVARLNLRMKTLREKGLTHALKKAPGSKKRKKGAEKDAANGDAAENGNKLSDEEKKKSSDEDKVKEKKEKSSTPATNGNANGIKNASTASLTQKVMKEQEERNKRRKLAENDNVKSLFSKSDTKPDLKKSADYMTRGFSIGRK
ncbi:Rtf2 RING-finger-domain-containing protein [Paraphoma chrysanthemicola]|uniref:Rtf2 RING-finger-domain-containing protein n=1 Tax=Paraphoma chrysanthemicola TaxID=798071 RepID=A0A8K0VZQ6_9PLEO|nr:Rtf2 RING-finger-domain-containing protein [Paraphoma chrysanthemicola]